MKQLKLQLIVKDTRIKGDKRLPIGFDISEDEYSTYYEDINLKIEGGRIWTFEQDCSF